MVFKYKIKVSASKNGRTFGKNKKEAEEILVTILNSQFERWENVNIDIIVEDLDREIPEK